MAVIIGISCNCQQQLTSHALINSRNLQPASVQKFTALDQGGPPAARHVLHALSIIPYVVQLLVLHSRPHLPGKTITFKCARHTAAAQPVFSLKFRARFDVVQHTAVKRIMRATGGSEGEQFNEIQYPHRCNTCWQPLLVSQKNYHRTLTLSPVDTGEYVQRHNRSTPPNPSTPQYRCQFFLCPACARPIPFLIPQRKHFGQRPRSFGPRSTSLQL